MQPKSPKHLSDIADAAAFILDATRGKSAGQYAQDRMLRQAVERNFEIIGEALNRLRRADAPIAARISAVDQIIAFRNILIHGYDLVEHDKVWGVIQDDLPRLAAEIRELLAP